MYMYNIDVDTCKLDTCIANPNISDEFDNWHCRPIQNAASGHFVKKIQIDLKWLEMRSKVIFGHPKMAGGHFVKNLNKN